MPKALDLTGKKFGRLTAIGPVRRDEKKGYVWAFRCDCGNDYETFGHYVASGHNVSCGCRRLRSALRHGHAPHRNETKTYRAWSQAKARCINPKNRVYSRYGGRGIKMCNAWLTSFDAFLGDMGIAPVGLSLDRIDNNGDYEPGNCRWATRAQQMANKENSRSVMYDGEWIGLRAYSGIRGVDYEKLRYRVRSGIDPVAAADSLAT